MKRWLIAAVLVAATVTLLAACGGDDDEGEHTITAGAVGNSIDRAFVAGMVPHHESAIEMAEMAQEQGQSEFVSSLADDIVRTQGEEIRTMRDVDAQLAADGIGVGDLGLSEEAMGMHMDMSELENAKQFDEMFLEMMIEHHRGAIRTARVELQKGENQELMDLAQQIIDAQSREISEMNAQLGTSAGGDSMPGDSGAHEEHSMDEMGM
jgi:uncharacterized protein (DUF305 family)